MNGVLLMIFATGAASGLLLAAALLWRNHRRRETLVLATLVLLAAVDVFLVFVKCALLDSVSAVVNTPVYISLLFAPLLLQFLRSPDETMPFAYRWKVNFGMFVGVQCMAVLEIWTRAALPWITIQKIMDTLVAVILALYLSKCFRAAFLAKAEADWPEFHNRNVVHGSFVIMLWCQFMAVTASLFLFARAATLVADLSYGAMACLLVILTYSFLYKAVSTDTADVNVDADPGKEKYGNNRLPEFVREFIINSLVSHMRNEKPWLKIDLTLGQLADSINVNPHHLSQIINSHFGKSFACFINEYRVNAACQLLTMSSGKTVLEIALDSGFSSKSSFNTLFKKQTGLTPSEYRKKFQNPSCVAA